MRLKFCTATPLAPRTRLSQGHNVSAANLGMACSAQRLDYNDPMSTISVQDIQRDLLAFLQRVEAGEAFLVVQGERPLAEVRPLATIASQPRPYGLCAGQFTVPADFDQLPDDILREFEGS